MLLTAALIGSHLFRRPDALKDCLIEGLSQSGVDCFLPEIIVRKNLRKFLRDELDTLFPSPLTLRTICHPLKDIILPLSAENQQDPTQPLNQNLIPSTKFSQLKNSDSSYKRVLVTIGPEVFIYSLHLTLITALISAIFEGRLDG